ncbi:MAG: nucleotide exchange factor GrpE [Lachnospiraceae bacterium]|nr:nucleotide exchange factor GrpE [Lachnospiraceae bacterium]
MAKKKKSFEEAVEETLEAGEKETEAEVTETGEDSGTAEEAEEAIKPEEDGSKEADKEAGKEEKADPKDEKIAELNDKVVRQMAEFDNFRKRSEKEKHDMFATGEKVVIEAILPVIDNFERALQMAGEDESKKDDPFIDGMQKVYKQLMDEMDKLGVKPIEALGADFDPNIHNAVMQEETEEYESGKVCKELQRGYMLNDTVIRHSMVSVAQ